MLTVSTDTLHLHTRRDTLCHMKQCRQRPCNIRGHEEDMIDAYLARPSGPGPHPGVVVIHHMPGWDEATKEIARKFAHHGYIAISPNLHFREGKGTPEENSASIRAAGGMPDERTMGDVEGAIAYLRTLPYLNGKVGIIGYCSGGRQVYLAACTLPGLTPRLTATVGVSWRNLRNSPRVNPWPRSTTPRTCGVPCSGSLVGRTGARRRRMWRKPKRNSKSGGRPTSSICTTMPVMASSRWIVRPTGNMRRWMGGRKSFNGLEGISADLLTACAGPVLPLLWGEGVRCGNDAARPCAHAATSCSRSVDAVLEAGQDIIEEDWR